MLSVTKNIIYSKYIFFRLYKLFILFHFDYKNEFQLNNRIEFH